MRTKSTVIRIRPERFETVSWPVRIQVKSANPKTARKRLFHPASSFISAPALVLYRRTPVTVRHNRHASAAQVPLHK